MDINEYSKEQKQFFISMFKEKLNEYESTNFLNCPDLYLYITEIEKPIVEEGTNEPEILIYLKGLMRGLIISNSIDFEDFVEVNMFLDDLIEKHIGAGAE